MKDGRLEVRGVAGNPSRRSFLGFAGAVFALPLAGTSAFALTAVADEPARLVVRDGWVLRSADLPRLGRR